MNDFGKSVRPRTAAEVLLDDQLRHYARERRARQVKAVLIGFGSVSGGLALIALTYFMFGGEVILGLFMLAGFMVVSGMVTMVAYDELERR